MNELKNLVQKLENTKEEKEQIRILQEIGEKLINCYTIQIGEYNIEPMLVEAYYYCDEKFKDKSVHAAYSDSDAPTYNLARARQKNNFGELYIHYGCKDGIDIVLSNGDYYLSFLIKNALVNKEFKTQSAISKTICEKCDKCNECEKGIKCKYYGNKTLLQRMLSGNEKNVVFLVRKGIKGDFADKKIAALPINDIKKYKFTAGESVTLIITKYIEEQLESGHAEEAKLKDLAKDYVSWKYFEK